MGELRDPFLGELWRRKAEEEQGETAEDRDAKIYFEVKDAATKAPELAPLIEQVEVASLRYAEAVNRHAQFKLGEARKDDIEASDKSRRGLHKGLVDDVNILSREFKKAGLSNDWRREMGSHDDQVGRWASIVASIISRDTLEEHGLRV